MAIRPKHHGAEGENPRTEVYSIEHVRLDVNTLRTL